MARLQDANAPESLFTLLYTRRAGFLVSIIDVSTRNGRFTYKESAALRRREFTRNAGSKPLPNADASVAFLPALRFGQHSPIN